MKRTVLNRSGRGLLVILGLSVVVLSLMIALSFKGLPGFYSLEIKEALICEELDDQRQPVGDKKIFPYGLRQVCLWFRYVSARKGSHVEVVWKHDGSVILSESVRISEKDGIKAFYLLKEEGEPLPKGSYSITISTPAKQWADLKFKISNKK